MKTYTVAVLGATGAVGREMIRILQERGIYQNLSDKLQQAAKARLENPEASLTELAAMMQPPISKPAMNHRLQMLVQKAQEGQQ